MKKSTVTFADSLRLRERPDAELLLICNGPKSGMDFDVRLVHFQSRKALEAFNKKAGLKAVISTQVPLNCAIYAHQSDSDARKSITALIP